AGAQPQTSPFLVAHGNEQKPQSGHATWPLAWQAGLCPDLIRAEAVDVKNGADQPTAATPMPARLSSFRREIVEVVSSSSITPPLPARNFVTAVAKQTQPRGRLPARY